MNKQMRLPLALSSPQAVRLQALQSTFAQACNSLAIIVRTTRCWNRVALHHMHYHNLRAQYPGLGSQMVCNAIYSVSRTCRLVYQSPASPYHHTRFPTGPLPLVFFTADSPVYFDRHTLSLKARHLSLFTLDGRMRFEINLSAADEACFRENRLLETVLTSNEGEFTLRFQFGPRPLAEPTLDSRPEGAQLPGYVMVLPAAQTDVSGVPA